MAVEYLPLAPFREESWRRRQRAGLTVGEVARRMDADRERCAVLLGIRPATYGGRAQSRVSYAVGVRLCRALEVAPVDVGV
jgi:hypothetical protein